MSWSVGEASALALKAARGAGMAWGQAEEAGFAVRWLQQRTAPGIEALSHYLEIYDSGEPAQQHCPIAIGTAISDTAITPPIDLGMVHLPLLLVPFIAAIANEQPIRLTVDDMTIDIFNHDFQVSQPLAKIVLPQAQCSLTIGDVTGFTPNSQCAVRVPDTAADAMARLDQFAHRTYAPATEESRMSGAGADKDVND